MNWVDLTTFRVVAEELSFTRAAERLHVSVSAVSQRVRRLEHTLRSRLLARTTTRVELTKAGRAILSAVVAIDSRWTSAQQEVACAEEAGADGLARPLRMAFYRSNPARMWHRLTELAPLMECEARHYRSVQSGLDDLRRGEIDFFVWQTWYGPTVRPEIDLEHLHSQDIAHDSAWASVGEHHPLATRSELALADLLAYDWVAPVEDAHDLLVRIFGELSPRLPRFTQYAESADLVDDLLRTSTAIDIGPPAKPAAAGIVRIPIAPAPRTRYALAWRNHPTVLRLAPDVLDLHRRWHVEQALENNPRYLAHMRANPEGFPGLPIMEYAEDSLLHAVTG